MTIFGRLTKDAEVRTTATDKQVVSFAVAINDGYKNKQGERVEKTTFVDCAYWLNTKVAEFLTKGTLVELTGSVAARAWIGQDGEAHAGLNFTTSQIKLHGSGKKTENSTVQASTPINISEQDDDLPF